MWTQRRNSPGEFAQAVESITRPVLPSIVHHYVKQYDIEYIWIIVLRVLTLRWEFPSSAGAVLESGAADRWHGCLGHLPFPRIPWVGLGGARYGACGKQG